MSTWADHFVALSASVKALILVAIALTALSGIGALVSGLYNHKLKKDEVAVTQAVASARTMQTVAENALKLAAHQKVRADSLEVVASKKVQHAQVSKVIADAPDTCKKVVAALKDVEGAYEDEKRAAGSLRVSNDSLSSALAATRDSLRALANASEHLVTDLKAKPTFWSHLKPHINVNPIDLQVYPKPQVGASVGLGWSF